MTCEKPSNARYVAGCRCPGCRAAHAKAYNLREMRNARGESYLVDAEPVRARIRALYAVGYSVRELDRMGISRSTQRNLTVRHHRTGKPVERVRRATAEKVYAVSGRCLARHTRVPADAARLLLGKWREAGIPIARVARATGISRHTLDPILHHRVDQVNADTLLALLSHKTEIDDMVVFAREVVK